ncbi:MAG: amidohydrolase [Roseinatronobacter sp.]
MSDQSDLLKLRHALHQSPDLSGAEGATAALLAHRLGALAGVSLVTGLGGHGLVAVFASDQPGPTVMLRAELDALPISDAGAAPYRSIKPGIAHLCGHDGHMAILFGVAQHLSRTPPAKGRVVLLFQPAEETAAGARAVLADPAFASLRPDWAFALHNMPGLPLGAYAVAPGPASCASVGVTLHLTGVEAHAAFPETGRSPLGAMQAILAALAPDMCVAPMDPDFRLATLCHMALGQPSFGIAPARGVMQVTLRAIHDDGLAALEAELMQTAQTEAARHGLSLDVTRHDHFNATLNDPNAAAIVEAAAQATNLPRTDFDFPMRPSEDFGAFSADTPTALFFLGAGEDCAPLHNPAYDFPDALLAPGVTVFLNILEQVWDDKG